MDVCWCKWVVAVLVQRESFALSRWSTRRWSTSGRTTRANTRSRCGREDILGEPPDQARSQIGKVQRCMVVVDPIRVLTSYPGVATAGIQILGHRTVGVSMPVHGKTVKRVAEEAAAGLLQITVRRYTRISKARFYICGRSRPVEPSARSRRLRAR